MSQSPPEPVNDWARDFDHTHPDYAANAPQIWDELRTGCPVAHTERFGGVWLPVTHDDVSSIAKDPEHFSSQGVIVTQWRPQVPAPVGYAPPITSDPPFHAVAREFLLTAFSPRAVSRWEEPTRSTCNELIDTLLDRDPTIAVDAAVDYAQHIPVRVIAEMLGVPREDGDVFRAFIHDIIESPGAEGDLDYDDTLEAYLDRLIEVRRGDLGDDLISHLIRSRLDGEPLTPEHIRGTCALLLIAGIDTTWSAIGASLWHMAQNPEDRRRWTEDPSVRPFAIEEFLRFYAPVTMARLVAESTQLRECPVSPGDWVLLPFPAANRDPDAFEDADQFIIDRQRNRHSAFGLGIHRCIGSNLARLELRVALETWMERIPEFELVDPDSVRWSAGQIRGPRELPVAILGSTPR